MSLNVNAGGPTPARPRPPLELPTRFNSSTAPGQRYTLPRPDQPQILYPDLDQIASLTITRAVQWVVFRLERRGDSYTKVPYNPRTGKMASSQNPGTWGSFDQAVEAYQAGGYDGIGFVFTDEDPYVGIDLDKCRNPETGELEEWAAAIVRSLNSYTEVSPSGTGVKIFTRGSIPGDRNRTGRIEIYETGRYFTVTGRHLAGTPTTIEKRQAQLNRLYTETFPAEPAPRRLSTVATMPADLSDRELIERAMAARNGGKFRQLWQGDTSEYAGDDSAADEALCCMLAFWTRDEDQVDRLFRASGLMRDKWDRDDYRERTITKALSLVSETYSPSLGQRNDRPEDSGPIVPPLTNATDELRDYLAAAVALMMQLQRTIEIQQRTIEQLTAEKRHILGVLRNPHMRSAGATGIAMIYDYESGASRGQATDQWVPTSRQRLAETSGNSPASVTRHLKVLEEAGLIDRDVVRVPTTRVNPETGELTTEYESQLRVRPRAGRQDFLKLMANYEPEKPRNWGGRPDRGCPDHPKAKRIQRQTVSCAECGKVLEQTKTELPPVHEEAITPAEPLNTQDKHSEHPPSPVVRGTKGDQSEHSASTAAEGPAAQDARSELDHRVHRIIASHRQKFRKNTSGTSRHAGDWGEI